MAQKFSHAAGRFAMTIGGQTCGFIKKVEIGAMAGDVFEHGNSVDNVIKKQLANFHWEDWSIECALGMGDGLYKWLKAAIDKAAVPQAGEIIVADFDYKAQRSIQFFDALITEINFPALKASDKQSAYITVKFRPTSVRWADASGDIKGMIGPKTKNYTTNNFRVDISGLTEQCKRVAEVGALKFESKIVADHIGTVNEPTLHYAKLTRPDIDLKFSAADAKAWDDRAKAWFIDGARTEGDEMTGSIEYLAADMKTVLATLTLQNVGFKQYKMSALEPNSESINYANAIMYVENYLFDIKEYDA